MSMNRLLTIIAFGLIATPVLSAQTITCISNGAFTHCHLPQADQRHISIITVVAGSCTGTNDWGVDSTGIWVNKGCGATFEYTSANTSAHHTYPSYSTANVPGPDFAVDPYYYYSPYYYNFPLFYGYFGPGYYYNGYNEYHHPHENAGNAHH